MMKRHGKRLHALKNAVSQAPHLAAALIITQIMALALTSQTALAQEMPEPSVDPLTSQGYTEPTTPTTPSTQVTPTNPVPTNPALTNPAPTRPVTPNVTITPAPAPIDPPTQYDNRTIVSYPGVDFAGSDMKTHKYVSYEACYSLCLNTNGCRAFTYNTRARWCFLKYGVGRMSYHKDAKSGFVNDGTVTPPRMPSRNKANRSGFNIRYNTDYRGSDYQDYRGISLNTCRARCQASNYCRAFSYIQRMRWCWLKSRVPRARYKAGVVSGVKR